MKGALLQRKPFCDWIVSRFLPTFFIKTLLNIN